LQAKYDSYNIKHGYGLGIILVGSKVEEEFKYLIDAFKNNFFYEKLFYRLGEIIIKDIGLEHTRGELEHTRGELEHTRGELEHTRGELEHTRGELEHTRGELEHTRGELEHTQGELNAVYNSKKWRIAVKLEKLPVKQG
jgi:hypothetical protein